MIALNEKLKSGINLLCIEGVIGAGKTSLTRLLSERFEARTVCEEVEGNPFLAPFYKDRKSFAFQTQLWFLLSRHKQLTQELLQQDLFHHVTISDYLFAKDRIFAVINLNESELALYNSIVGVMERDVPKADLVIYLQASTDTLMKRIDKRARAFERTIERKYIETLNEAYSQFFFHYTDSPLLIINTDNIDFVGNGDDLDEIVEQIVKAGPGTNFYQPMGAKMRPKIEQRHEERLDMNPHLPEHD